jgi:hypothetical protein
MNYTEASEYLKTATPLCPLSNKRSSSPRGFHSQALTEPCVNLSIHTALVVQPLTFAAAQ